MTIEQLTEQNFSEHALDTYVRTQLVQNVYRKVDSDYKLVHQPYTEDWDLAKKRAVAAELRSGKFITYLALENGEILGFISFHRQPVGKRLVLEYLQVSCKSRHRGIGRALFKAGKAHARAQGAAEIYISACSSEETIAFYTAMGAKITDDPIPESAAQEPFDLQMVCPL